MVGTTGLQPVIMCFNPVSYAGHNSISNYTTSPIMVARTGVEPALSTVMSCVFSPIKLPSRNELSSQN